MLEKNLLEVLTVFVLSLFGALFMWQAHREWVSENYFMAFYSAMFGVWIAGKLIGLSFE